MLSQLKQYRFFISKIQIIATQIQTSIGNALAFISAVGMYDWWKSDKTFSPLAGAKQVKLNLSCFFILVNCQSFKMFIIFADTKQVKLEYWYLLSFFRLVLYFCARLPLVTKKKFYNSGLSLIQPFVFFADI